MLDAAGRPLFKELLFGHRRPTYVAFDLLIADGVDLRPLPLRQRKAAPAPDRRAGRGLDCAHVMSDMSDVRSQVSLFYYWSTAVTMTLHATLVFERDVPAPIEKVFAAFADPVSRSKWGVPSDAAVVIYDEADFREGGRDRFRCGSKANPNIYGTTQYLDIVANRRVVSSETISMDGRRLCVSLTTLELAANGETTKLTNTTQLASFIGADIVKGHETGTNASLDNLVRYFRGRR